MEEALSWSFIKADDKGSTDIGRECCNTMEDVYHMNELDMPTHVCHHKEVALLTEG